MATPARSRPFAVIHSGPKVDAVRSCQKLTTYYLDYDRPSGTMPFFPLLATGTSALGRSEEHPPRVYDFLVYDRSIVCQMVSI